MDPSLDWGDALRPPPGFVVTQSPSAELPSFATRKEPSELLPKWMWRYHSRQAMQVMRGRGAAVVRIEPVWGVWVASLLYDGKTVHYAKGDTPTVAWLRLTVEISNASGEADLERMQSVSFIELTAACVAELP